LVYSAYHKGRQLAKKIQAKSTEQTLLSKSILYQEDKTHEHITSVYFFIELKEMHLINK